jgi:hypothetical protein
MALEIGWVDIMNLAFRYVGGRPTSFLAETRLDFPLRNA